DNVSQVRRDRPNSAGREHARLSGVNVAPRGPRRRCDLGRDRSRLGTRGLSYCEVVSRFDEITRHDDAEPDDDIWVGAQPVPTPILVVESDPTGTRQSDRLAIRIRDVLGDRALALEHVGSTSVPGLPAKKIIDIDLTVVDS